MAASSGPGGTKIIVCFVLLHVLAVNAEFPEKVLCADANCRAPISRVQTVFSYDAPDPHHLSFSQHDVIQVFAKDVDDSGLWTGELLMKPGRVGLFNKDHVKELVVFNKRPSLHVNAEDLFEARLIGDGFQRKLPAFPTPRNADVQKPEKEPEKNDAKDGNGTEPGQDFGGPGYIDDESEDDDDYDDYDDEDDDDDDWSYYDRKYIEEQEEEDFLEELLDARGGDERTSILQKTKMREEKVSSHGEDQDKGDLEEIEKSHYKGPIDNNPPQEKLDIVQKVFKIMWDSEKEERKREEQANKILDGPPRGEVMKAEEVEEYQQMERRQQEAEILKYESQIEEALADEEEGDVEDEEDDDEDRKDIEDEGEGVGDEDDPERGDAHESMENTERTSVLSNEQLQATQPSDEAFDQDDVAETLPVPVNDEPQQLESIRQEQQKAGEDAAAGADSPEKETTIEDEATDPHNQEDKGDRRVNLQLEEEPAEEEVVEQEQQEPVAGEGMEQDRQDVNEGEYNPVNSEQQTVEGLGLQVSDQQDQNADLPGEFKTQGADDPHPDQGEDQGNADSNSNERTGADVHESTPLVETIPGVVEATQAPAHQEGTPEPTQGIQDTPVEAEDIPGAINQHKEQILPNPSIEVIDGTTIYLEDLEPTPMPNEPPIQSQEVNSQTPQQTSVFTMQGSDIVDMPQGEREEEGDEDDVAPPPTTFSMKSEEEIDPEAYRNILHRLHANPELSGKEGAIQQEMLKILRDPELKKTLLVKPPPAPKRDILSPFVPQPQADGDVSQQTNDLKRQEESQEGVPELPVEPKTENEEPGDFTKEDPEDPLTILKTEGVDPEPHAHPPDSVPEPPLHQGSTEQTHNPYQATESKQVEEGDTYDPAKLADVVDRAEGPNTVVDTQLQQDPAGMEVESGNHAEYQEPPSTSQDSPSAEVKGAVNTSPVLPEVPSEGFQDQAAPETGEAAPSGDTKVDGPDDYAEPLIRSSTRFPLQYEEEAAEQEHYHDNSGETSDGGAIDSSSQEPAEDNGTHEGFHHQLYTREENQHADLDDGVTVETVKDEEEPVSISEDDLMTQLKKNLEPAIDALNHSVFLPLFQMFPVQFQRAIQQPDFLGIPWISLFILEVSLLSFIMCLVCCMVCGSRRHRRVESMLKREVDVLTTQKAEVMDALDMTNVQFKKQNLEFFELRSAQDQTGQDKSKLEKTCKELEHITKEQKEEVDRLKSSLKKKSTEYDSSQQKIKSLEGQMKKSQSSIKDLNAKARDLEGKVYEGEEIQSHLKQEVTSLEEQNRQLHDSKTMIQEELTGQNERFSELTEQIELLNTEKKDMKESLVFKDNEIEVLKDCLLQLKGIEHLQNEGPEVDSEAKIQQLMDVTRVNAKLSLVLKERDELQDKLDMEVKSVRELETKTGSLRQEIEGLRMEHSKAKSDHLEAQTKMEVLQEYFKTKEVDLQRKLGREEALKLQSEEQVTSLSEKAISAEVDLNNYRQQIADLKAELDKSERNYRTQVCIMNRYKAGLTRGKKKWTGQFSLEITI
ncbi:uncharacterized protein [Diadema antillarum]|uniref:uncharacterized protein n=1 Tax=Diadema antillarum TaxID=105358 RepID=UPI003A89CCDE